MCCNLLRENKLPFLSGAEKGRVPGENGLVCGITGVSVG